MKKLLVIAAVLFSTNAFAGILVEPYAGYAMGSFDAGPNAEGDVSGMSFGARLGYSIPMVFFAFDGSMDMMEIEPDGQPAQDTEGTNLGATVGVNLSMLRLWAGYIFSAENTIDNTGTPDDKYEGNGYKAGLGFKIPALPISINLEYVMTTYDEANGVALTDDLEVSTLFASVSVPLNF